MVDREQIYKWWSIFHCDDSCVEVRILGRKQYSGYYKDVEKLIQDIEPFDAAQGQQIYFTLNVVSDECYGRMQNEHLEMSPKNTTSDNDIVGRRFVLIDLDPKRSTGVNASNEELEYAHRKAVEIYQYLKDNGFNEPVIAISGNGYHLLVPCSIGVSAETDLLVKRFLAALSMLFSDERVDIDEKVFNRSRICKLYGTVAKKGANIAERPWRRSKIIRCPDEIKPNDIEYFRKIADLYPEEQPKPSQDNNFGREKFDLEAFMTKHDIKYRKESVAGGTKYILDHCVFNPEHKGKDAMVFQRDNGALSYVCLHNSCSHYGWKDFRMKFEPDAYDHKDYAEFKHKQNYFGYQPVPFVPIKETEDKGKKWLTSKDVKRKRERDMVAIPTGFYLLDKVIRGLLLGEVTIMSGINGSGKSSWLNTLILNVIHRGYKVAAFSGELTDFNMMKWLAQSAAGKNYLDKLEGSDYAYDVQDAAYDKIMDWLYEKFYLFNNNYGNKFEQIVADVTDVIEKGVNLIIIDNLMALSIDGKGGDKNDRQKAFILDLVELAKSRNVHIIVVAHPRKENGFSLLRKESISGSSDLSNAVNNVFIIHRVGEDFQKRATEFFGKEKTERYMVYDNVIEVCKNRSYGINDLLVGMYYEVESKRFKNTKSEHVVYGWQEPVSQPSLIPPVASSNVASFQSVYDNINNDGNPFTTIEGDAPF